jgi:hypothetical protein
MMRIILIAYFCLLFSSIGFVQPADALTFKKDGSVVQKDGTVVRPPKNTDQKPEENTKSTPLIEKPAKKALAVGRIPDWCNAPPENTVFRISACGTASAINFSMAKNRALLDAKRQLADVVNGAIEFANNTVVSSASDVPIRGYKRLAEETKTIRGRAYHFVLLQMEIGPAADLMTQSLEYSIDRFKRSCPEGWKKVDNGCVLY